MSLSFCLLFSIYSRHVLSKSKIRREEEEGQPCSVLVYQSWYHWWYTSVLPVAQYTSSSLLFSVSSSSVLLCSDLVVGVAKALLTSSFVVKVLNVTTSTKKKSSVCFQSVKTSKKSIEKSSVFITTFPFKCYLTLDGVLYSQCSTGCHFAISHSGLNWAKKVSFF